MVKHNEHGKKNNKYFTLLRNTELYYYPHLGWVVQSWVKVTQG